MFLKSEHKLKIMNKKVLIFSLAYYPKYYGGAEVAIKEITDRIDDVEFHMITMRFDSHLPKQEKIGNIFVHRIGFGLPNAELTTTHGPVFYLFKMLFVPMAALKVWQLHRIHNYDGLWAMMSYMLFPIVLSRIFGMRIPYALTLQEGDPFQHVFERWYIVPFSPLLRFGFKNATIVQAISTFLGNWAGKYKYKGKVEIIPNAVNTKHFSQHYSVEEIEAIKKEIGKREGEVYLVTTSRLVEKNAIDDVIRALQSLNENIKFLIFGTGPDETILKNLAKNKGVEDRVIFWGQIDHLIMPKYLKACDIFIRPSRSEGMGNSFVESFAAELPVVATQEGGIADFLFDEKRNPDEETTGWAVDKNSPEQIAKAVQNIIDNPEKVEKVKQNSKKLAFENYDWNIIAKDMREKVFGKLFDV
jgi:glycosyltransferase involved in cell wall biosynthesis